MFNRLVGGAIFALPDTVMRQYVNYTRTLQCRKPDSRTCVIGENKESSTERNDPAVQRHSVHSRSHAELTNTEIYVAPGIIMPSQRMGG